MEISSLNSAFLRILGSNNFFCGKEARLAGLRSPFFNPAIANLPFAVARPAYPAQISKILSICDEEKVSVRFRGNKNSLFPNPFPGEGAWLLLESAALDRIIEISPENLLVRVMAGIGNEKLAAALARRGFFIPALDQRSGRTIGGILSENSAQAQYPKYGPPASSVLEMGVTLANGKELRLNGACGAPCRQTPETPLAQIFCGSLGKLGFITEITLRITALPEKILAFALQGALDKLLSFNEFLPRLEPAAAYLTDPGLASLSGLPAEHTLLLYFDNSPQELPFIKDKINRKARELQLSCLETNIRKPDFYRLFTAILPEKTAWSLESFACLPGNLANFLPAIRGIAETWKIGFHFLAYPRVASVYCLFVFDDEKNWPNAQKELRELKLIMSGMALSEEDFSAAPMMDTFLNLPVVFDPAGILSDQKAAV